MKKENISDTFCLLPFTHISTTNDGNYRACCCSEEIVIPKDDGTPYNMRRDNVLEVWNSDHYKKLRLDLLSGIKNPTCEYCWNYEASGAYSKRQKTNDEKHDMYPDYDIFIKDALLNEGALSTPPTDLDIKVGTQCNLKCIMCYPGSSSLHQDEQELMIEQGIELPGLLRLFDDRVKKFNFKIEEFNPRDLDIEPIMQNLDPSLKQAIHLSLVGGEPLVNKTTQRLIEQCVEKGYAKNMMLQIITNLSVINPKTIRLLDQFKHPMLCISYDHIDPRKFNFIRYPADYSVFKNNFEKLWEYEHIEKKLSTTWGIFNIFDFEDIFNEWETIAHRISRRFVINFGLIYYPNYFSLRYLELDQKKEITERINNFVNKNREYKIFRDNPEFYEAVISVPGYMGGENLDHEIVCKERTRVLDLYDQLRGTNYQELFPYIKRF
jgi:organic radical activating enzyme